LSPQRPQPQQLALQNRLEIKTHTKIINHSAGNPILPLADEVCIFPLNARPANLVRSTASFIKE
jgi:hypothetical protein